MLLVLLILRWTWDTHWDRKPTLLSLLNPCSWEWPTWPCPWFHSSGCSRSPQSRPLTPGCSCTGGARWRGPPRTGWPGSSCWTRSQCRWSPRGRGRTWESRTSSRGERACAAPWWRGWPRRRGSRWSPPPSQAGCSPGKGRVVIWSIMQISKDPHLNVGDCNQRVTAGIRLRKRVFNQFHFSMDILKHIYVSSVGGHSHLMDKSNSFSCPIFALWPCKPKVYFSRKAKYLGKLSSTPLLRFTKSPQRYCIYVSFKHLNTLIEMTACVTGS